MAPSERNNNSVPSITAKSNAGDNADVIIWGDPATHRLLVSASVAISGGSKTNNAAAPTTDNLGVLPAVANVAAPTYTEGNQVLLSTDLTGALRVTGSLSVGGTTDNSAFTAGTTTGTPALGFYHSTLDTVTDGRAAVVAIDSKRSQFMVIRDAALNARGANVDANNNLGVVLAAETTKVIGTINLAAAQTLATVTTVSTVTAVTTVATVTNLAQMNGAALLMGNGVTGTGSQRVTLASDNSALPAWGHGATGAAIPAGATAAGGLAKTANPSAASDGNMTTVLLDKLGKQIVVGSIRDLKVNQITTITASASETTVLTAVASTFLDVYGVIVTNTSATAVTVAFKDSTAGTTQFNIAVPAGETRGFMLPEGGAVKQTTVNNNWTATTQSVSSVIITMLAVKNI